MAKSLGLSLDELHAELDDLKLRRKAYRLVRGSDAEIAIVEPVPGAPSGPPVRRRSRRSPTAAAPPAEAPQTPQAPAASQGARPELPPDKRADAQPRFGDRETSGAAPVEDPRPGGPSAGAGGPAGDAEGDASPEPGRPETAGALFRRSCGGYIQWWARADSNCRPPACQAGALTN